jgi:hypothetical protein
MSCELQRKSHSRHLVTADLSFVSQNDLLMLQIRSAPDIEVACSVRESACATYDVYTLNVVNGNQSASGRVCSRIGVSKIESVAALGDPVMLVVEHRSAITPARDVQNIDADSALEISSGTSERGGWVKEVCGNASADLPAMQVLG